MTWHGSCVARIRFPGGVPRQWSVEQVEHAQATGKFQAGRGASSARPAGMRASSRHARVAVALISLCDG